MPQIINYISSKKDTVEIYIAPNTFPMERNGNLLIKIIDNVLTSEDVRDTLVALKSHTPHALGPLSKEGSFSFGLQGIGRFRVTYMIQRGSYVIHIVKTPHEIPHLHDLCEDTSKTKDLEDTLLHGPGLLPIIGNNSIKSTVFVYTLLKHVCSNYTKVVFILEDPLSFLLRHEKSLVIQREVGSDVESFEEGLRNAILLNPDIIYIGFRGFLPSRELISILRLIELNATIIINFPYMETDRFLREFSMDKEYIKAFILLRDSPVSKGKLSIEIKKP